MLVGLQRTLDHTTYWPGSNIVPVDQEQRGDAQLASQVRVDMTQGRISHVQLGFAGDPISSAHSSHLSPPDAEMKAVQKDDVIPNHRML